MPDQAERMDEDCWSFLLSMSTSQLGFLIKEMTLHCQTPTNVCLSEVIAPSRNFKVIYLNSFDLWCYIHIEISIDASWMVFGILVPDFEGVDIDLAVQCLLVSKVTILTEIDSTDQKLVFYAHRSSQNPRLSLQSQSGGSI